MTGAHEVNDEEFVRAFESCELSNTAFRHADHIRLARIYLSRYGAAETTKRFGTYLRKFAAHHGNSEKYHETITVAWVKLVAHTPANDLEQLMDKNYLRKFYSPELLATDAARTQFVEPDREKLPG